MIGILSDAHGNIGAFILAISLLKGLGVRNFYYLGDAIGYIPSLDVINELQSMGNNVNCILGNHELMLLSRSIIPNREDLYQHQILLDTISCYQIAFLKQWSTHSSLSFKGVDLLFVHGSPNDYSSGYVYPTSDLNQFNVKEHFVFMGHTHYPFIKKHGHTTFVNVGSCGLPRDNGRYGSCATYDPDKQRTALYRFSIDKMLDILPARILNKIHPAVMQIFKRNTDTLIGQVISP